MALTAAPILTDFRRSFRPALKRWPRGRRTQDSGVKRHGRLYSGSETLGSEGAVQPPAQKCVQ